jgi:flagellin
MQNSISTTQKSLSTSMTRLSTGYRINSAMDDAAGLQIATRLKAQSSGMAVAMRNTQNSISMLQTAEGALNEVGNILVRMKDLATQSADGSSSTEDQTAMQGEFDQLTSELSNIMANTKFGGSSLLQNATTSKLGATAGVTFQIGADSAEKMVGNFATELTAAHTNIIAAATQYSGSAGTAAATAGTEINATNANGTIGKLSTAINSGCKPSGPRLQQPVEREHQHRQRNRPHHGRRLRDRIVEHDLQADADAGIDRDAEADQQHVVDGHVAPAVIFPPGHKLR